MLPERYLVAGLDALCRAFPRPAWSWDGFIDAHRGAAMTSGCFMLHDRLVEAGASAHIQAMLDREWSHRPIFAAMPAGPASPEELGRLLEALGAVFGTSSHVGHHVIFPTCALRVFQQLPETITVARIDGLCTMAEIYAAKEPLQLTLSDAPFDVAAYSAWVLESFLQAISKDQAPGIAGHLLTFGQAVVDLHVMGYLDLARKAEIGHREYVSAAVDKPAGSVQEPCEKPAWMRHHPHLTRHWREQAHDRLEKSYGHAIKFAHAFNALCARVHDRGLVARAREQYYQVGRPRPQG